MPNAFVLALVVTKCLAVSIRERFDDLGERRLWSSPHGEKSISIWFAAQHLAVLKSVSPVECKSAKISCLIILCLSNKRTTVIWINPSSIKKHKKYHMWIVKEFFWSPLWMVFCLLNPILSPWIIPSQVVPGFVFLPPGWSRMAATLGSMSKRPGEGRVMGGFKENPHENSHDKWMIWG